MVRRRQKVGLGRIRANAWEGEGGKGLQNPLSWHVGLQQTCMGCQDLGQGESGGLGGRQERCPVVPLDSLQGGAKPRDQTRGCHVCSRRPCPVQHAPTLRHLHTNAFASCLLQAEGNRDASPAFPPPPPLPALGI